MPDWSPLKIAETAASDWFWKGRIPPLQFWTNVIMHESSNVFPSFFLFFSLFSFLSYEFPFLSFSSPSILSTFLDASPHLYKRVCPSVCPSICLSVCPSVCPFFKNPQKRLFSVADDIRMKGRTSRDPYHTHIIHTHTHPRALTRTRTHARR